MSQDAPHLTISPSQITDAAAPQDDTPQPKRKKLSNPITAALRLIHTNRKVDTKEQVKGAIQATEIATEIAEMTGAPLGTIMARVSHADKPDKKMQELATYIPQMMHSLGDIDSSTLERHTIALESKIHDITKPKISEDYYTAKIAEKREKIVSQRAKQDQLIAEVNSLSDESAQIERNSQILEKMLELQRSVMHLNKELKQRDSEILQLHTELEEIKYNLAEYQDRKLQFPV